MPVTVTIDGTGLEITDDLVAKYDRPLPRYTSYPTVPVWTDKFTAEDYALALQGDGLVPRKLSLYLHIPFCRSRCAFCGCSTIAASDDDVAERYLQTLKSEISLIAQCLKGKNTVQVHLGGGSPNYLSCRQMEDLWNTISSKFSMEADAEIGIEVDPRTTSKEQIKTLAGLGFNRMSIGVQDLSDAVQKAIGRIESYGHIAETIKLARSVGFKSINCDLVYGLPHQTVGSFGETIKKMIALDPDRLACFNFAYLPASMPHQSGISSRDMPRPREKLEILCRTIEALGQAGYDFIGMDHFAKRTDELSLAARNGTLWRNFQGYTTKAGTNLIGFGMTAISDVNECYAQNAKTLDGYHSAIDSGRLATVKGWRLSKEDVRRRDIIRDIFCGQGLFLRNIAAQFDEYLGEDGKIFSRAI